MSTTISIITSDYLSKFNNLNLHSCSILLNTQCNLSTTNKKTKFVFLRKKANFRFFTKKLHTSPALPAGEGVAVISCNAQLADQEIPQGSPSSWRGLGGGEQQ
jgi:hypothetical protein